MEIKEELKDRIKKARQNENLTQKELAKLTGLTQATITKLETGLTTKPNIEVALKISNALKIDIYDLFGDSSINNPIKSESEKDRLKILAFSALEKYVSNQSFFSQMEINENASAEDEWKRHSEYQQQLLKFKNGIYETFVNVGFCTQAEIKEFKEHFNLNKEI